MYQIFSARIHGNLSVVGGVLSFSYDGVCVPGQSETKRVKFGSSQRFAQIVGRRDYFSPVSWISRTI